MKPSFILIATALVASFQPTFAQIKNKGDGLVGNGRIVNETRSVETFDRLQVDFAMKVRIAEGDPTKAEVEGEQNVLPYVNVSVSNGELVIGLSRKVKIKETKPVIVTIHRAALQAIEANTACTITSELPVEGSQLSIRLNEACKLTTPVAVQAITVDLQSASSVTLQGKTQRATFRLDGASRVTAAALTVAKADISLDGASHAVVHVTDTLSAEADGVSSLTYTGNPTVTSQHTSGLSSIKRKN